MSPQSLLLLTDGVSEAELNEVEKRLGVKLPLDLRCAYRIHNGQKFSSDLTQAPFPYGYVGCSVFSCDNRTL